jgi:hypothetical protein
MKTRALMPTAVAIGLFFALPITDRCAEKLAASGGHGGPAH